MPRLARSSVSTAKPQTARKKHQKRNLDAYAIASHSVSESQKLRRHRLGEVEGGDESRRKRQRMDEDEDDEDEDEDEESGRARASKKKSNQDELDLSGGSDSEGHTWRMGEVDDDDDSEIDSDEAFGESDEERFEGFIFRGSSKGKQSKKASSLKRRNVDEGGDPIEIDLNESEEGGEDDDDSFGEEGVDLATMLDQPYSDSEEEESSTKKERNTRDDSESPSEEEDIGEDGFSDLDMSDAEDAGDANKQAKLKRLISSLQPEEETLKNKRRGVDVHESSAPSEFGVTSQQKLSLEDLLPTVNDPALRKSLKLLKTDSKSAKRNGIPGKLEAPLPKRQQDRISRVAANEKTNETLTRWVDTVKQNRRAEHLSFPLVDPEAVEPQGVSRLLPAVPLNDLESTIQSILQESGLATTNGKTDEDQLRAFEELQTNKLPVEEVLARRAELRRQRELLFREEIRAKRVKKIKSKAYRRVHRKERERIAERERDMLKAEGVDVSEDEKEYNDRRRAEERMGAKHRESKWAKGMKASGRAVWDDDARAAVTDMARRNEELRRRIEGKDVAAGEDDDSDVSDDDSDDNDSGGEHSADDPYGLRRQLEKLQSTANGGTSKLGSMLFMQRAEAAKKARTDEDIERIRMELAGEDSQGEESDPDHMSSGRRKYGPSSTPKIKPAIDLSRNDFEEHGDPTERVPSEDDVDIVMDKGSDKRTGKQQKQSQQKATRGGLSKPLTTSSHEDGEPDESNPWITGPKTKDSKRSKSTAKPLELIEQRDTSSKKAGVPKSQPAEAPAPNSDGWTVVSHSNGGAHQSNNNDDDSDSDDSDVAAYNPLALGNDPLIAKAFAGDEVVAEFNAEKTAITAAEDTQTVDDTLPGWGNWVGANVSKRDRKRNAGRFLTEKAGLEAAKRKDAKLEKVIINEKRVKKNTKFLAGELPFPFESREQYERSLRIPKGKEWTTKSVFQQNTKPRVLVKKGVVIEAMSKPMV